jgi:ABC-type bacteriocin/lantibiotic exporter with double-glycine peptidase domain
VKRNEDPSRPREAPPLGDSQPAGRFKDVFLSGARQTLLFVLLAGLLLLVPSIVQPAFTRIFIDDVLTPERRDWLPYLLGAMGLSLLAMASAALLQRGAFLRQILKSSLVGGAAYVARALRLPYAFFTRVHGGEAGLRSQYVELAARILVEDVAATGVGLLAVVAYAAVMWQYDAQLTAMVVVMGLLNVAALQIGTLKLQGRFSDFISRHGNARAVGLHGLQNVETLKASGLENEFFASWAGIKARAENAGQAYSTWAIGLRELPVLLTSLSMAFVLFFGAARVMRGDMTIGMLAAFQLLLAAFAAPVQQCVNAASNAMSLRGYFKRLDEVAGHPPDPVYAAGRDSRLVLPGGRVRLSGRVELDRVTFGYVPGEPPLIRDFSLSIAPGSRVALVGASGSGKTTVVRLIAQLYSPWAGRLRFDSLDPSEIPHAIFSHSVSFVDQDIFLFEGTVRDNLTLWNPAIPDADIMRAIEDAGLREVISARRGGLQSAVVSGGANFSGGQRQRLEIARALAVNPSILVLDEATSALDAEMEERIDAALRRRGVTCLIVAHRLSTIRDADEILVLDRGLIVERGTHDQLMAVGGRYRQLLTL